MREVSKAEFFAVIGPRDVNPRVDVSTLRERHHTSTWETPQRETLGRSISDGWAIEPTRFFLRPDLAKVEG